MLYKLQKCALCGEPKELQLSHIVPKFVGRHLKGTSIGKIRSAEKGNVVQDLEKHYMLCHDCEELFSASETWFAKNIFYPWKKDNCDSFTYNEKLFFFLTSLSWRSLYLDILDFVENSVCSVAELECLIAAEKIMRDFLNKERNDIGNIEHHIFFFDRVQEVYGNKEKFAYNPNVSIHRSVTSYTITYENGTYFTISNLMGIIVVTFYKKDTSEKWLGTEIHNGTGTLVAPGQKVQSVVGNEFAHWLESAKQQYESLPDEQKEKIVQKLIDIGEDIKNYDIYQDYVDDMNLL